MTTSDAQGQGRTIRLQQEAYSPNVRIESYGSGLIKRRLTERYGERYTQYRRLWAEAEAGKLLDFPINIEFDLIDGCSLSCRQCLRHDDFKEEYAGLINTGRQLRYETIARVLEEAKSFNLPSVNIGGSGECMLHKQFTRICRAVMDAGVMEFRIISNGTFLTEEISRELVDMQQHILSISIDAFTAETFGKVRSHPHLFETVKENIFKFLEVREKAGSIWPLLRITFVHQPDNTHEKDDFLEFWSQYADMIDVQTYADYRRTDYSMDWSCFSPFQRLTIWADGHFGPCCGFPGIKFDLGNCRQDSIKDVWNGAGIRDLRHKLQTMEDVPAPCLQCRGTAHVDLLNKS